MIADTPPERDRIDAIRTRREAATPGEWTLGNRSDGPSVWCEDAQAFVAIVFPRHGGGVATAEYIAHSKADLTFYDAYCTRLLAQRDEARSTHPATCALRLFPDHPTVACDCAQQGIDAARLLARVAELEGALAPFAEAADRIDDVAKRFRSALSALAVLLLVACNGNGGGSPPIPQPPPLPLPPAPTKAAWIARYDLPGLSTNCAQGDSGQQGFSCGRMVESLVAMFRATGERVYLDRAALNVEASLAKSEACAFAQYPAGTRCWTSTRYSTDARAYPYLLHDGWWWLATLGFVAVAKDHPDEGLRAKAEAYLAEFENDWRTRWDADYRPGAFVLSAWQTHYAGIKPGWSLPHNMTATWTLALHRYGAIVGRPDPRVAAIAARFKTVLIPRGAGVVWRYADKLLTTDPENAARYAPISDSDHAATNAFVMAELAKVGVVFNASDVAKAAYTFRTFVAPGGYLRHFMDGSGLPDGTEVGGWAALPGVGAHVAALLDRPGNPYGSERLAVALSAAGS